VLTTIKVHLKFTTHVHTSSPHTSSNVTNEDFEMADLELPDLEMMVHADHLTPPIVSTKRRRDCM
jgi:hypothetical protein